MHRSGSRSFRSKDEHAFALSWGDLRDAICLRYGGDLHICQATRHVAKGGSEGADEPPFSRTKKKMDGVRVWQLCVQVRLRLHRRRPYTAQNRILKVFSGVAVLINVKRSAFL